jgi:hypothetical protein
VDLDGALAIEDETERMLSVVALIADAVRDLDFTPVVVGGLAVQYWTYGEYATSDIDILLPSTPEVHRRLESLGLSREGRHWVIPGKDVFVEAPGSFVGPGEETEDVELPTGGRVRLLRPEDVLIYRLHEFVATGHREAASQAVSLYLSSELDRERLHERATQQALSPALTELDRLAERIEGGERIETWDLHEIARRLR